MMFSLFDKMAIVSIISEQPSYLAVIMLYQHRFCIKKDLFFKEKVEITVCLCKLCTFLYFLYIFFGKCGKKSLQSWVLERVGRVSENTPILFRLN